ncbi:phage holin family protein [Actimicrobium antarcticum]|uniref:Phage holin family protein n=1 Tax=Actimicrobium antarcticum TaxID=1051899 RepID=A0ABP7T2P8_9BURK
MDRQQPGNTGPTSGLIIGLAGMARNFFSLLLCRIELAAIELAEVRSNLLKLMAVAVVGAIAAFFALVFWTGLLVALTWDALGWKILLIIAAAFTAVAIGVLIYAQSMLKNGQLSLPATLAELRNDRDALL